MLDVIFSTIYTGTVTAGTYFACTAASIIIGALIALTYMYKTRYTASVVFTLAIIPFVVQTIIMMVNGSIGAGIAVAGAFSLVRFRSIPGTAKEISCIFLSMTAGLAIGMGYVGVAAIFAVITILLNLIYTTICERKIAEADKVLKVTIPETLNYTGLFDDLFQKYTSRNELFKVKTIHLGSLFQLEYRLVMKDPTREKEFIDEIRCRNGNLDILLSRIETGRDEL